MNFDIIINIIIGLIIGIIIYYANHKSYKYKGPDSNIIKNNIYKLNDKCYKFVPIVYICPLK